MGMMPDPGAVTLVVVDRHLHCTSDLLPDVAIRDFHQSNYIDHEAATSLPFASVPNPTATQDIWVEQETDVSS